MLRNRRMGLLARLRATEVGNRVDSEQPFPLSLRGFYARRRAGRPPGDPSYPWIERYDFKIDRSVPLLSAYFLRLTPSTCSCVSQRLANGANLIEVDLGRDIFGLAVTLCAMAGKGRANDLFEWVGRQKS